MPIARHLGLALLRGYKAAISPMLPASCRFVPTCSEYALEAVERFGVLRGGTMAVRRLLRCHPFGGSGYDPVVTALNSISLAHRGEHDSIAPSQTAGHDFSHVAVAAQKKAAFAPEVPRLHHATYSWHKP